MEERITQVLKSIGLGKSEIEVYLDLAKYNASSALEISNRTKIHRPNVYDALRRLMSRGFVKEVIVNKRKAFEVLDPEKILNYVKHQEHEVGLIVPKIKEMIKEDFEKEDITIDTGLFTFRRALISMLNTGKPIYAYSLPTKAITMFGHGFAKLKDFQSERIKKKVLMKLIYSRDVSGILEKVNLKYAEIKHFARRYDHLVSTIMSGDKVIILIFTNPLSIINIKNKEIADSYHKYFSTLWKNAIW
jgi:sugar-specific transcriptional regulator TrmB